MPQLLRHHQNLAQALERASAHYERAASYTSESDDPYVSLVLDYATARAIWAEGQLLYVSNAYELAIPKMESFVDAIQRGDNSLIARIDERSDERLATEAYQMLGVTNFQLADLVRYADGLEERATYLELAEHYLQQCISTGEKAEYDDYVQDELVMEKCTPLLAAVGQALEDISADAGDSP